MIKKIPAISLYYQKVIIIMLFCLVSTMLFAQTGSLEGFVLDKKSNITLVGATVSVDGTSLATITDADGHFILANIKIGFHFIKVTYIGYIDTKIENIEILKDKTIMLNAMMDESEIAIQEVTINAKRRAGSDVIMMSAIKNNTLVASGISGMQIQKSQDRDASEVVRRVPGITIIDDRFIIIRGLNQRYNNVWLNNAATPSSETDVKAFSFDVIPSGLIDNIMIYKSAAPELPADFTGGFVKITTKNMPDDNFISIDYASSYRNGTTSNDFFKYQGGKSDWLGFDDGIRALPNGFPSDLKLVTDPAKIDQYSKAFNKNWTATSSLAKPDQRIGLTFGRKFTIGKVIIGNTTAASYSNTSDYYSITNNSYVSYDVMQDQASYRFNYHDDQYTNNSKASILHNWSLQLGKNNKLEFRNLFNQIGFTRTTLRDGRDYYGGIDIRSYEYRFLSRSTYSGQLAGQHCFREGFTMLDWNLGYAYANRLEPDRKVLTTKLNETSGLYEVALPFTANPRQAGRLYLDNREHIYSHGLNLEHKIDFTNIPPTLKMGYYTEYKMRKFNARNIGYAYGNNFDPTTSDLLTLPFDQLFSDENFDYYNKLRIAESTNKADSYDADNKLAAGYIGLNIPFSVKLNLYAGLRAEYNQMTLSSFEPGIDKPVKVDNKAVNFFPSANMSYNFTTKTLVRFAYGRSINRPEFREIAPFVFFDFNDVAGYSGNPELKDAIMQNIDLRFEHYPSGNESVSLALFYKAFENPIEMVNVNSGSGLQYTFQNAKAAKSMGIELELRKSLDQISVLRNFTVILNGSLIKSKVEFPDELKEVEKNRPLFGQSPYIANAGLYYQNPKNGLGFSCLYNVIGERIIIVGQRMQNSDDNIPDIYEMPHSLLDFTISKKIGKHFEIKGGVKDLLNEKIKYQQTFTFLNKTDNIQNDRVLSTKEFQKGSVYTLGLSLKF